MIENVWEYEHVLSFFLLLLDFLNQPQIHTQIHTHTHTHKSLLSTL